MARASSGPLNVQGVPPEAAKARVGASEARVEDHPLGLHNITISMAVLGWIVFVWRSSRKTIGPSSCQEDVST